MKNFMLIGEMASGKDTVAMMMPGYIRLAFGDEIRVVVQNLRVNGIKPTYCQLCKLFEMNPPSDLKRQLEEFRKIPKINEKDRELLQELGTYCRKHDDLIWVRTVLNKISGNLKYVITDVRRFVELEACKDKFIPIYIHADEDIRKERLIKRDGSYNEKSFYHEAEKEIRSLARYAKYYIVNNSTLESLEQTVRQILKLEEVL